MDAKRLISLLPMPTGGAVEVADPARRLEMGGADELLFLDGTGEGCQRLDWIHEVARSLFIPFTVSCDLGRGVAPEKVLEAGADKVLLQVGPGELAGLSRLAQVHGRNRIQVAVEVGCTPEGNWVVRTPGTPGGKDPQDWMGELEQAGAGEILLIPGAEAAGLSLLSEKAARLALPVLLKCASREAVGEALLHGMDGVVLEEALATPADLKSDLADLGLAVRR